MMFLVPQGRKTNMTKHFSRAILGAAMLALWAGITVVPASASELYNQPTNLDGTYASQNDTTYGLGNFATAYDNFTLSSTSNITEVTWVGSYFSVSGAQLPGTITGFNVDFWSNASGAPGIHLAGTGDVAGNAGETYLGSDNYGDPTYSYSLNTAFTASAGTMYWLSIVPDSAFPPQWGWEIGTGGDGAAYQVFLGNGGPIGNDLAFALYGNTVTTTPEPASIVLFGTFLAGSFLGRRKIVKC
jgi:hypothetical protein